MIQAKNNSKKKASVNKNKTSPVLEKKVNLTALFACLLLTALLFAVGGYYFGKLSCQPAQTAEPPEALPEEMLAGEVGEVLAMNPETGQQEPLIGPSMPLVISTTGGEVIEVKLDKLIIAGSGSSFADNQPREITCLLNQATIIIDENGQHYGALDKGQVLLQPGAEVAVSGDENIRGKTEFKAQSITILN